MRYLLALSILALSVTAAGMFTACSQMSTNASNASKATPSPGAVPEDAKRISLPDAKTAYDAGTAVFYDTRPKNAYDQEHIKGSVSFPGTEMDQRLGELPKDKQLIFYCS
jgi:hypothetical protein